MLADVLRRQPNPPPSFNHLRRMTDETGLLEHALSRIPRRAEGYTTDDNARALWLVTEWLSLDGIILDSEDRSLLTRLAEIYMAFLLWNQDEDGWWHNNVEYNRQSEFEMRGEGHDCQGRAIWAAADAWIRLDGPLATAACMMAERALPQLGCIDSLRGQAYALAACAHMLEADGQGAITLPGTWKDALTGHLEQYESLLNRSYRNCSSPEWRWFEQMMTYGNGVLPWALLRAYRVTKRRETLENGLESLAFLLDMMTAEEGWLRPIGNSGWGRPGRLSKWDQQPLEIFKLALALAEAETVLELAEQTGLSFYGDDRLAASLSSAGGTGRNTQRGHYAAHKRSSGSGPLWDRAVCRDKKMLCLAWFYGLNDKHAPMCDPEDGSGFDGLTPSGPNINCGAESTISYLMTEALCRK